MFSAACGGGVPFLHNLSLAVLSDRIESLGGILNGTTNYMLDAMQRRSLDYGAALSDAQKLGYAEADPTADVSGLDALRKIMLGCAVGFDALPDEGLDREGIESITAADVADIKNAVLPVVFLPAAAERTAECTPMSSPCCSPQRRQSAPCSITSTSQDTTARTLAI